MAKGLLFASFDFSPAQAGEFHDWYDLEHIPERLRVPGFLNAERWISDENPKIAVATYDLESPAVMESAPYRAIGYENASVWTKRITAIVKRILRFAGEQIRPGDLVAPPGAGALLMASMDVDPAAEAEFNEWYDSEHLPQLGAVPGVLAARRYRAQGRDTERQYLALYHLRDVGVSRCHASLAVTGAPTPQFSVRDLGSRNGTTLNQVPIAAELPLRGEGELGIGELRRSGIADIGVSLAQLSEGTGIAGMDGAEQFLGLTVELVEIGPDRQAAGGHDEPP